REDRLEDSTPIVIGQGRRLCAERAAGSPLYCTYLSRELIGLLDDDPEADVEAAVADMPPAGSELAAYYEYLLADAGRFPGARQVAYLLALVDFALTAQDMKEILGALAAGDVEGALAALRPLLTEVGTEAAFRVHHESFQRFVIDRLASADTPVSAVLEPLNSWLEDRGLFGDARAFRHLLPSLRRSGRGERVLELVSPSFVADAVASGHPYLAAKANIDTAAAAAAARLDLPGLAKCAELARAAASTYEDKLYSIEKFATAVVAAHGALGVAERLIHEGRPTWPRRAGMYLCRASDLAGGVPPWREYLDLPRDARENLMGDEEEEEAADRCAWLGRLRLAEEPKGLAISILRSEVDTIDAARELLRYLFEVSGAELIAEIAPMLQEGKPRMAAWLELAKALDGAGQAEQRRRAAELAAEEEGPASLLNEALEFGADPSPLSERLGSVESLVTRARDLSQLDYIHELEPLEEYRLELRVHGAMGADLEPVRLAVEGGGWWQDFLRFCVDEARGGIDGDPLAALRRLTVNAHPYAGTPRAMDLYSLRPEIARTINAMGAQVRAEARSETLELLTLLARKTGGAYNFDAELDFCESQMESDAELFGDRAIARIEEDLAGGEHLYEEAAELCQRLAAIHLRQSEEELAQAAWTRAATYLAGYGFRKDITFYELIEGLDDLAVVDREGALRRAIEIQPFASLVVQHTDGKETRGMPGAWFRRLCALSPPIAGQCLARSFRRVDGNADYRVEAALDSLLAAASGNPRLIEAIGATSDHSTAARRAAVEALLGVEEAEGERALLRLIAATDGDGVNPDEDGVAELESLAAAHGIETEERQRVDPVRSASSNDYSGLRQDQVPERSAFFPAIAGVGGLLHAIRTVDLPEQSDEQDRFVLGFGFRLLQLAQDGDRPGASRLLRTFARKRSLHGSEDALEQLADGFERYGENSLAAQALILSWTVARRNWWARTGGARLADRFIRAKQLDAGLSERTVCVELAEIIRADPTQYGLSQGVIGLLAKCGEVEAALASWDAAASVITRRLPALGQEVDYFAAAAEQDPGLDLDPALSYLLASRFCHPRCPISREALAGLGRLASADPVATAAAVAFLLEADTPDFALTAILQVARDSPHAPEIAAALEEQLMMVVAAGGIATAPLAAELLTAAALPVPAADRPPALVLPTLAIAPGKTAEAILSLDFDDRVERLEARFEELAEEVAAAFDRRWRNSETAEPREKQRARLAHTIPSDERPAEVRLWGEDLFQGSLEEALAPRL
ncbi:MAG TPA: hypothetical protein VN733_03550, partial [Solirubrobacterales bacterium]|nr:hypothetical protein [Solirubrobacterales bacterium]